ncbi:MAG TPA: pilus assembly protein CpaF, partial [Dermatophilaceae bacterium]|nr:pilus assembly protein CpaF [Dermatophilaceae bacterium]
MSVERARLRSVLAGVPPTEASVGALAAAEAARLGSEGVRRRRSELRSELLGLGPLDDLVHDPAVSDVAVNGDGSVWCDDGGGMSPRGVLPGGSQDVRR